MIRNIKLLALTALAALAVTAVAASAAHAEQTTFTAGSTSGTITATNSGTETFSTVNGTVVCKTSHLVGTFTATSFTTLTVTPTYTGCEAFGFAEATVTTTGCTYTFTGKEGTGATETLATSTVKCSGTSKITVSGGGCTTTVGPQGPLNHVKFSNTTTGTPDDVDANTTFSGITYVASGFCFRTGTFTDGTLNGNTTVIAKNTSGTQVNLTVDP